MSYGSLNIIPAGLPGGLSGNPKNSGINEKKKKSKKKKRNTKNE